MLTLLNFIISIFIAIRLNEIFHLLNKPKRTRKSSVK